MGLFVVLAFVVVPLASARTDVTLTAPSSPVFLHRTADSKTSISVAWSAPADGSATGYAVAVDGSSVDTTTDTSYELTGLSSLTTYGISVTSTDGSDASAPVSIKVTTPFSNAETTKVWRVVDLGTLGGSNSYAWGINNYGQIVGEADTSSGATHAFIYQDGAMRDLSGASDPDNTAAFAINDEGEAVGGYELWDAAGEHDLPFSATAINDGGLIVGSSQVRNDEGDYVQVPMLDDHGITTQLDSDVDGGSSVPSGIDSDGTIVGYAPEFDPSDYLEDTAVAWYTPDAMPTALSDSWSHATAIEDGAIYGDGLTSSGTDYSNCAFIVADGQPASVEPDCPFDSSSGGDAPPPSILSGPYANDAGDLVLQFGCLCARPDKAPDSAAVLVPAGRSLASEARGRLSRGQVIAAGSVQHRDDSGGDPLNQDPYVYADGAWTDVQTDVLTPAGWGPVLSLNAINDNDQIVGTAVTANGDVHAILIESVSEPIEQTYGDCQDGPDAVDQSTCLGDANASSGAFSTSVTDASLAGIGVPFSFVRSYTSADQTVGRLGRGWTDSYDISLSPIASGDGMILHGETGQQLLFVKRPDGSYESPQGSLDALSSTTGGGFEVVRSDQTHLLFNSDGLLTSEKDPNGEGLTFDYDGDGNLASITDSGGRTITVTTNGDGTIASVSYPGGREVDYGYTSGLLTSVTDARGGETDYTYDSAHRLKTITDPLGHQVTDNTYADDGRLSQETDALDHTTTYAWDPSTDTETMTDPRGHTSTTSSTNNMATNMTDPLGHTTTYDYGANGDLTSETDANSHATTMTYDAHNNMLTRTTALSSESWTYDDMNDVLTHTDADGNTTSYEYDAEGNRTEMTQPGGIVTTYTRDPDGTGLLVSETDPRDETTSYGYDSQHNLTSVTSPIGNATTNGYDTSGRLSWTIDPRGNISGATPDDYKTTYTYDKLNHKTSETDPLANETDWEYDAAGNLASTTDANSHATSYTYDDANELDTVVAPGDATTTYSYDNDGNLISRVDANDHETDYSYDDANRLATKTTPQSEVWQYSYDNVGNRIEVDAPDGTTDSTYDALNRLTGNSYSDSTPAVTFGYDGVGNRTSMTDGIGTETISYDSLNRPTEISRDTGGAFSYSYDDDSNVTERDYPDGTSVDYAYDDDGNLSTVQQGGNTYTYSYDSAGNQTGLDRPNGITETRTYDDADQLTEIKDADSSGVRFQSDYGYDPVGDILSKTTLGSTVESYHYDNRDRLTAVCDAATCPGATGARISWTYDPVDNRITETRSTGTTGYSYNTDDELSETDGPAGTVEYGYDGDGNQTGAGDESYSYDLADRLISASNGTSTTNYTYDGDSNRLSEDTDGTTTQLAWDTNNPLPQLDTESDSGGGTIRDYIQGLQPLAYLADSTSYSYHYDNLGSITAVTSPTGDTEWTYSYDPFGTQTATKVDPDAPDNPLGYTGQYQDPNTGLLDLRARQYDPSSGRFLATDPRPLGPAAPYESPYAYAGQDPVINYDLAGDCPTNGVSPVA